MSLVSCYECGKTLSTTALACPHCGAPQPRGASPSPRGVRFESRIEIVEPDAVDSAIKAMEYFGYTLQDSQEIIGESQEAPYSGGLFASMFRGALEGFSGKKTYVREHYVRLHFVRDLALPNLAELRELERINYPR